VQLGTCEYILLFTSCRHQGCQIFISFPTYNSTLVTQLVGVFLQSQDVKFFCSHIDDLARSDAGLGRKEHKTVVWGFFSRIHGDDHLVIVSDHLQAAAELETTFLSGVLLSFQMCYFSLRCVTFLSSVLLSFQLCYFHVCC